MKENHCKRVWPSSDYWCPMHLPRSGHGTPNPLSLLASTLFCLLSFPLPVLFPTLFNFSRRSGSATTIFRFLSLSVAGSLRGSRTLPPEFRRSARYPLGHGFPLNKRPIILSLLYVLCIIKIGYFRGHTVVVLCHTRFESLLFFVS